MRPDVANALFTFKIVFGNAFHCDRGVFKMLGQLLLIVPVFEHGIDHNESKDRDHNENVDDDYSCFLHNT